MKLISYGIVSSYLLQTTDPYSARKIKITFAFRRHVGGIHVQCCSSITS